MVLAVEYPIRGGNDTSTTMKKIISHPPGSSRHDFDIGESQSKKACEYTAASMRNTQPSTATRTAITRHMGDSRMYAAMTWLLSALNESTMRREKDLGFEWEERRMALLDRRGRCDEERSLRRDHGGGDGEREGDTARASAADW